jgi:putative component of membrane protein insertase Oxa1/YidC/SpoIIIJ protein YidD
MNKFLFILFVLPLIISAQPETYKWQKEKTDYKIEGVLQKKHRVDSSSFSTLIVSGFQFAYYKLFSDYDGDNCPFYPSCSAFFVDAVEETNIIQGALMFADRFTRDTNFFKGLQSYQVHKNGKFYDPAYKYTLGSVDKLIELEISNDE